MKRKVIIVLSILFGLALKSYSQDSVKSVITEYNFNVQKLTAIQFLGKENYSKCHDFVGYNLTNVANDFDKWLEIRTNEVQGVIFQRVYKGQWIVKWVYDYDKERHTDKYVFLVFHPDYFNKLFERAEP